MGKKRILIRRRFIDAYIRYNGNATKAYLSLHPNCKRKSAGELGYRMLKKVDISISEILDRTGITDTYLGKKLLDGLNAKKTISVIPLKLKEDFATRARYLGMAFKLKGKYPSAKHQTEETKRTIVIGKKKNDRVKKKL